ncbi:hypothetical protein TCCBUS3UF1_1710 [Thermus sp. CCB_US3_UF1]|nr:hypothetical protein TCCBUS3UF1_1710 [Thermus sp. CCB_US3_UF1]
MPGPEIGIRTRGFGSRRPSQGWEFRGAEGRGPLGQGWPREERGKKPPYAREVRRGQDPCGGLWCEKGFIPLEGKARGCGAGVASRVFTRFSHALGMIYRG